MHKARIVDFRRNGDPRGFLVAVEGPKELNFEIARVFYMFGMDRGIVRGKHANRKSRICFVSVAGSCKILVDDGANRQEFLMDDPCKGLLCEPMTWKEMYDFSPDCVLMGISDSPYDAGEYIGDNEAFKKETSHG